MGEGNLAIGGNDLKFHVLTKRFIKREGPEHRAVIY